MLLYFASGVSKEHDQDRAMGDIQSVQLDSIENIRSEPEPIGQSEIGTVFPLAGAIWLGS